MIYTVTFNPALDYVVKVEQLVTGHVNRTTCEEVYYGGKGINVSVVLQTLGIESVALGFIAGFTGEEIEEGVKSRGIHTEFIRLSEGISRINIKIKSDRETEINANGPSIPEVAINELFEKLDKLVEGDTLVLAGSIPSTLPNNIYEQIMERLYEKNIRFVVDATKDLLKNVLKYRPFLIKPNKHELGEMFDVTIETEEDIIRYANELKNMGAQNVLISMAKDGAILIDENNQVYRMGVPNGNVVNSVGAGDSMVAGFLAGYIQTGDYGEALRLGTASGSATAFSPGLGSKELIDFLLLGGNAMYHGIAASTGVGLGHIVLVKESTIAYDKGKIVDVKEELERFNKEMKVFITNTRHIVEDVRERIGDTEAKIIEGQIMIISDPTLITEVEGAIRSGICGEQAVEEVCDRYIQMFSTMEDDMMRHRASDIHDIKTRFLKQLIGIQYIDISKVPANTILVAHDLTPSMIAGIVKENVVGIVTEVGGVTSHSAILARALEIPAVLGVENCTTSIQDSVQAIVDGDMGIVITNPSKEQVDEYEDKHMKQKKVKKDLLAFKDLKTKTADGMTVGLFGNIGTPIEAQTVIESGADGVGLFRTEFLFMDKSSLPSEEEQFKSYREAVIAMNGKPIIIRTLDIGGDKEIPYLEIPKEDNPFLGYRAIRYCIDRPEVYRSQLRALLRASEYGDIRIMVPLVTCIEEIRSVKELLKKCKDELDVEGISYNSNILVGVMIETPAACMIADLLAKEVDFFSIGTNDLTQYTMAVDRGNAKVAALYSTYQPAVLRSIRRVIQAAKAEGIMVGMCGEAASDRRLIPLLLAFGIDEFSVSSSAILATRKAISEISMEKAKEIAKKALQLTMEREVYEYLTQNI